MLSYLHILWKYKKISQEKSMQEFWKQSLEDYPGNLQKNKIIDWIPEKIRSEICGENPDPEKKNLGRNPLRNICFFLDPEIGKRKTSLGN